MTKKIVISGYYGFNNFGDELILSILIQHIKQLNTEITVLSSNPPKTSKEYLVNSIYTFNFKEIFTTIKNADILISGGGSLLQDATSIKSLLYYLFVIFIALIYSKNVVIFAQGIGPIKNPVAKLATKLLLKHCKYISVRDSNSKSLLNSWNINADLLCDPAFSLINQSSTNSGIIGVQLREFPSLNRDLLQAIANQIIKNFKDKKIKILSLQNSIDYNICEEFEKILKEICPDIKTEIVSNDIIKNIQALEYLIAMRYHALLIAAKAGVKSIAINYDIKVENFAKDCNIPIISMIKDDQNIQKAFIEMKNLNSENIKDFANSQIFDWNKIDLILRN